MVRRLAPGAQVAKCRPHGARGRDEQAQRVDRQLVSDAGQRVGIEVGGLAALDDVGQKRHAGDAPADGVHLVPVDGGLDEHDVGTCIAKAQPPGDGFVQSMRGPGVRAGNDENRVAGRVLGGLDLGDHLCGGDDLLPGHVSATLGEILVLQLDRGHAGPAIGGHRVANVEDVPVPGIAVGDDRDPRRIGHAGGVVRHLCRRHEADVGGAEKRPGHAEARHVAGTEAGLCHESCRPGVIGPWNQGASGGGDQRGELLGGGHRGVSVHHRRRNVLSSLWRLLVTSRICIRKTRRKCPVLPDEHDPWSSRESTTVGSVSPGLADRMISPGSGRTSYRGIMCLHQGTIRSITVLEICLNRQWPGVTMRLDCRDSTEMAMQSSPQV